MKKIILILGLLAVVLGVFGYTYVNKTFLSDNVSDAANTMSFKFPKGTTYEGLLDTIEASHALIDFTSFQSAAGYMGLEAKAPFNGYYRLGKDMSNRHIVNMLKSGNQKAVKVTFNNQRKLEDLAGEISQYLEVDSLTLLQYMMDPETTEQYGLTAESMMSLFIPNSYQIYWDAKPEAIVSKLASETETFWSKKDREAKASALGLSKSEVYTLASIVEKESQNKEERPMVAGVYLNRIRRGMKLEADPTVVFATGLFDLRRVLFKHLEYDSPYNTYKYEGLPPGPIYMPSINSIDAVLNAEEHDYIFFCAKPGYNSEHLFAKTNAQHVRNARKYQRWLSSQGIR